MNPPPIRRREFPGRLLNLVLVCGWLAPVGEAQATDVAAVRAYFKPLCGKGTVSLAAWPELKGDRLAAFEKIKTFPKSRDGKPSTVVYPLVFNPA